MKFIRSAFLIAIAFAVSVAGAQTAAPAYDLKNDPTYKELSRLAGGTWRVVGGKMSVESLWRVGPDKTSLVCETYIEKGKPGQFVMNARFGWDPTEKKVYYLDAHGHDTVYFGHAAMEGKEVVIRFAPLVGQGDTHKYVFRCLFTGDDEYKATLSLEENGKEGAVVENFVWKRTK